MWYIRVYGCMLLTLGLHPAAVILFEDISMPLLCQLLENALAFFKWTGNIGVKYAISFFLKI